MSSEFTQTSTVELTCHYCGEPYADSERDSSVALRRHLRSGCPQVPAEIRRQYERRCPAGRCNP